MAPSKSISSLSELSKKSLISSIITAYKTVKVSEYNETEEIAKIKLYFEELPENIKELFVAKLFQMEDKWIVPFTLLIFFNERTVALKRAAFPIKWRGQYAKIGRNIVKSCILKGSNLKKLAFNDLFGDKYLEIIG